MKTEGLACILLAAAVLLFPLNWLLAGLLAAAAHELCHLLAVKAMGGRVLRLRVTLGGLLMDTSPMGAGRELVCLLAGPVGALALLVLCRRFPRLAICAMLQSAYNLLPIYPLDGGRALRILFSLLGREKGENIALFLGWGCLAGVLLGALLLRIPAMILPFLPLLGENFLAKRGKKGYNIVTLK